MITHSGRTELFRARVGSKEYNLNTDDSDDDFKVFILPTFDDLYFGKSFSKMSLTDSCDFDVHDIRKLYKLLYNSNMGFLGALYSDNIIINEELSNNIKSILNKLFEMKDEISKMNLSCLFDSSMGIHYSHYNELHYKRIDLIDKYEYNTKAAMSSIKTLDFIIRFADNDFTNFKSCYKYSDDDPMRKLLLDIRNGKYTLYEYELIYLKMKEKAEGLKQKYKSFILNEETNQKLKSLFKDIVKESLKDN